MKAYGADDYWQYIDKEKSSCGKLVFKEGTPQKYIDQYKKECEDEKKGIHY